MVKSFYKRFLLTIVVLILAIFLNDYFFNNFFQNFIYKEFSRPSAFLINKVFNLSRYSSGFLRAKNTIEESLKLKEENILLRGQLAELDSLKRENDFLRKQLVVAQRIDRQLLLVQIFNIQRGVLSSAALINKGANDGIKKSMPIISAGNVLAGIVDQVFDNSASVILLDDSRAQISGRIQESRVLVGARGGLHDNITINLVANSDEVKEGDIIITSGLDGLPDSLLIAKVTKVETQGGALFKSVTASPFFDPLLGLSLFVILQ